MLRRDRLETWLGAYAVPVRTPSRVLVVMAGNIPLVGFFDLLCVVASGHCCIVKPSAKDRVLIEYVVGLLRQIEPCVAIEFCDELVAADAVIATGGDNANRYFRSRYADVPSLLRGSRRSAAVLSGGETPEQLTGLADDIWAYSGLGCRNVSLVFIPENYDLRLTPPDMNSKYRNNYRQTRAVVAMTDRPFIDLGVSVLVGQHDFPAALSAVSVARYRHLEQVEAWLAEHDAELQCVASECLSHSRRVDFGRAQLPSLTDYPDARDVMAFLVSLD